MYVIYIKCQDLVVQFSLVLWVWKLILVWVWTACRESKKVAYGGSIVIGMYDLYKTPRFGGPVFRSVLSRKTNFSSLNSMSRIREGCTWRFLCNLYIYDLYKAPRLGGPVFSTWSALSKKTTFSSLNSTTRIREGRTWRFYCNLYIGNLTRFLRIKYIWDNKFNDENFVYPFVVKGPPVNHLLAL